MITIDNSSLTSVTVSALKSITCKTVEADHVILENSLHPQVTKKIHGQKCCRPKHSLSRWCLNTFTMS